MQVSPPTVRKNGPLQMLVTNLDYDEHKGRIAIGRVTSGKISRAETVSVGRPGTAPLHLPCLTSHQVFRHVLLVAHKVQSSQGRDVRRVATTWSRA